MVDVVAGVVVCKAENRQRAQTGAQHTLQHQGKGGVHAKQPNSFTVSRSKRGTVKCFKSQATRYNTSVSFRPSDNKRTTQTRRGKTGGEGEKGSRTHTEAYKYKHKEETTNRTEKQQELTEFGLDVERHPTRAQFV